MQPFHRSTSANAVKAFVHNALAAHVRFGSGTVSALPEVLERLGCSRPFAVTTPRQGAELDNALGAAKDVLVGRFARAQMHTPVAITVEALAEVQRAGADCVIAIGGGSAIGLGKAIALRTGLRQIAVPTTYAGSEMTPVLGQTENGLKTTLSDPQVQPAAVIYDSDLTLSMPVATAAASGLNAMAHAVEGLYARDGNPLTRLMSEEAIRVLHAALPQIKASPVDRDARAGALYGAWLAGMVLASSGMALHHKLCHTLGGTFGLPHAQTHAVMLPHALAYNADHVPEAMAALRRAMGTDDPVAALRALGETLALPGSLRELGMPESGIATATQLALQSAYWNPRPLAEPPLCDLIARAWAGHGPHSP